LQMIFNAGMNALLHPGSLQEFPDAAWKRKHPRDVSTPSRDACAALRST
jgi:hypothetical protein